MRLVRGLLGSVIGGLLGAAIWALIAYYANLESGWIAWGVGALAGFGMALGVKPETGPVPGGLAVLVAVGSICIGKLAANEVMLSGITSQAVTWTDDDLKSNLADEVIDEREQAGKAVAWPAGKTADDVESFADYPPDIQREATKRFTDMPESDRDARKKANEEQVRAVMASFASNMRMTAFKNSFGLFDILFFGLAIFTAFKLGAGGSIKET